MYLSSSSHLLQSQGNVAASTHWHHCSSHLLQPQSNDVASIYCGLKAILRLPSVAASRQYCSVRLLQSQGNIATSICCSLKQRCSFHLLQSQGIIAASTCCTLETSSQQPQGNIAACICCILKQYCSVHLRPQATRQCCSFHLLQSQGNIAVSGSPISRQYWSDASTPISK